MKGRENADEARIGAARRRRRARSYAKMFTANAASKEAYQVFNASETFQTVCKRE